ncbi:hypothetical protein J4734_26265 [Klebsiella pneumoniae]|uniref:Uncharacterized protein n=1 Tax=Klebsiella pneumoniae TaxID=573 RepID=A0A939SSQ9_KLEPN|nr:hypothetical protein [Klebsiella pneumoniae]
MEQLADNNTICKVSWDERIELAQIALSAMDCEPVAWAWHYREQWHVTNDERRAEFVAKMVMWLYCRSIVTLSQRR